MTLHLHTELVPGCYGIANQVLAWLDTNRPDGLTGGHR